MAEVKEGDVLAGKYRVERILGEGGMGFVVAATHITLDERVALKFMRAEALGREDGPQRFLREARAAVKLKSQHVARVLDVGTLETGAPYIVMEHLEGQDLAHVLAARGALPLPELVSYVLQACDALAEAHARGIIHRDIKPANIFVTHGRDGTPLIKVLDFGISKINVLGDRPESMTSSATLLGSPVYMSPEQMKSSRDVDAAADIWSLGIILYESVGGRVPFDELTMGALMAKVLTEPPPPLATLRPDLPPGFVEVVGRCLEKDPAKRYASIAELAMGLAPFGGPGTDTLVARIVTMATRASDMPGSVVTGSRSLETATPPLSASSSLAVAATQLHSSTSSSKAPPASKGRAGLYATVGLVGAVIAAAAFMGTRSAAEKAASDRAATDSPPASAAHQSPESPAPASSTSAAAAAAASASSAPATPSADPTLASAAPKPNLATPPTTPTHHPHATPSAKPGAPADPFGSSRQ